MLDFIQGQKENSNLDQDILESPLFINDLFVKI